MGRKKKIVGGKVVSVRVTDDELKSIRELMELTNLKASDLMRKAMLQFFASFS
ncbi:MAG TPA: DUF6290 family protein [Geobacteraceae bacterium]